MKYHLKFNGKTRFTREVNDFSDLMNRGEFVTEGWRTESELLRLGYLKEGKPTREVTVKPEEKLEVAIGEDIEGLSNFKSVEDFDKFIEENKFRKDDKDGKLSYIVPEVKETQFYLENNFVVVVEDETQAPDYIDNLRKEEYNKEGCTVEAMVVALWEKIMENKKDAADALQIKRQAVKVKHPKT